MYYIFNDFWQQRIAATFQNAPDAYPRVLMLRVDLRLPDAPAATDAAVISRFTESLKAKITASQLRRKQEGKRVHPQRCGMSGLGSSASVAVKALSRCFTAEPRELVWSW